MRTAEVVVIGGGVIGSSIAYHLARQGREVLVIEYGRYVQEPAASWANAGGIRRQGQEPAEAMLARMASARWPLLAEELEADLHYHQHGHLLLAADPDGAAGLPALVAAQHAMGFDDIHLLDRQQVHDLVPGLSEAILAGSLSPADGQADPIHTARAFAHAAQRLQACYWYETNCEHLLVAQDRIVGVQTSQGLIAAEHVVLAAGAWSRQLAASVGLDLPIRARVLQVLCSTPAPICGRLPVLGVIGRALSLKQRSDGCFLLGGGWLGDLSSDGWQYRLREAHQQANWALGAELFRPLQHTQLAQAWGGVQAHVFDDLPLIGSIDGYPGLSMALGSWHGFGLAPAIGHALAQHLAQQPTPELDLLSPNRISSFDPAEVALFLNQPIEQPTI